MHCDEELGNHTLKPGEDYHFDFSKGPKTLIFCHLWWNGKNIGFDVFRTSWKDEYCVKSHNVKLCGWLVRPDGIYIAENVPPRSFTRVYTW
ncbi:hypothetical protein PHJA_001150400 [Phtheirospermum japonicum]|uniref:S-protein homolog n=1 Tax=Phtheirospermum japonicum TaxID=374723 RepID=A0A830BTE5_9LAMI|nr:hypothetical protein PHJA_001150400 [Phtheirospermum japonicum]